MDLSTFIVSVFCLIDDHLKGRRIRRRGPAPKLSDSEVLTIEVVGEFLGLDTDRALYRYFRRHYGEWFPAPPFARSTAQPSCAKRPTCGRSRKACGVICLMRSASIRRSPWWTELPRGGMSLRQGLPL